MAPSGWSLHTPQAAFFTFEPTDQGRNESPHHATCKTAWPPLRGRNGLLFRSLGQLPFPSNQDLLLLSFPFSLSMLSISSPFLLTKQIKWSLSLLKQNGGHREWMGGRIRRWMSRWVQMGHWLMGSGVRANGIWLLGWPCPLLACDLQNVPREQTGLEKKVEQGEFFATITTPEEVLQMNSALQFSHLQEFVALP